MKSLSHFTCRELNVGYEKKEFSVSEVVESTIKQVQALDPKIKAFLSFNPDDVRRQAQRLDQQRESWGNRPLFGVPVAIKDNMSTKGIPTTCGSQILNGYVPMYDATVVARLREAGAIVLGKTNMDEFAMGSSTENSAYGPTSNPWDITRVPGGSSGGSAAAVVARMAPLALGSDTGGSIRQPAALTGTIGLKCTYGLVSRYGLVAYGSSLDQIGPFGRTVEDVALALEAMAGLDAQDSTSQADPQGGSYRDALQRPMKGLKAGVPKEFFSEGLSPEVRESVNQAIKTLEALGVRVEECSLPHIPNALPAYYIIAPAEASSNLARFDGVRFGMRKEGKDIIELYSNTRGAGFGPEVQRRILVGTYVLSSGYYDAYYLQAMKVRRLISNEFEKAFASYDFLISPTTPTTAFKLGEKTNNPLEMYLSDVYTIAVNLAGIPAISIPCGFSAGLPIGLQLLGPRFGERTLLAASHAYLEETRHHQAIPGLVKEVQ